MTRLESQLADAIVRVQYRLPDVRETMVEALFAIRRAHWVAEPRYHRRGAHV
jgi:hypothetical protein